MLGHWRGHFPHPHPPTLVPQQPMPASAGHTPSSFIQDGHPGVSLRGCAHFCRCFVMQGVLASLDVIWVGCICPFVLTPTVGHTCPFCPQLLPLGLFQQCCCGPGPWGLWGQDLGYRAVRFRLGVRSSSPALLCCAVLTTHGWLVFCVFLIPSDSKHLVTGWLATRSSWCFDSSLLQVLPISGFKSDLWFFFLKIHMQVCEAGQVFSLAL
jgi:hypothetical protein